jgi:hypothetical protein
MGTSGSYGGPRTGLIPAFLNDPAGTGDEPAAGTGSTAGNDAVVPVGEPTATGTPSGQTFAGSFTGARTALNRFARGGHSHDLGKALSSYVNRGTGGARRASVRMGASRAAAARLLGVGRDAQSIGPAAALQRFNLGGMAGQPAADVFLRLLEFVCPPGGSISEAISRQAMLDAILHLTESGDLNFDQLTAGQWEEFLLDFVSCSIEGKILADIGTQALNIPDAATDVGTLQNQLHDFVAGCVRSALSGRLGSIAALTDREIASCVHEVYEATFEYASLLGELP